MSNNPDSDFDASICPQKKVMKIRSMCKAGIDDGLDVILSPIFYAIVCNSKGMMDQSYAPQSPAGALSAESQEVWDRLVMEHPDFRELLVECCLSDPPSFSRIRSLEYLKPSIAAGDLTPAKSYDESSYQATIKSWSTGFRGESHDLLYNILKSYLNKDDYRDAYARYVPFVQSSGTGKSRMLDELAKRVISIPINLEVNHQGSLTYPPPDDYLINWIRYDINPSQADLAKRYHGFLFGLMTVLLKRLKEIQESDSSITRIDSEGVGYAATAKRIKQLATEFRSRMTETEIAAGSSGFKPQRYCNYRKDFYAEVILLTNHFQDNAISSSTKNSPSTRFTMSSTSSADEVGSDVISRAKDLYDFLDPYERCLGDPLLVISFDESHSLTDPIGTDPWTRFSELRRALRALSAFPFFSIFLSTAGKFHLFSPDNSFDASNRIQLRNLHVFPPITEVGFDEFADHVVPNGEWKLERLASTDHIAHLGRALFPTRYDSGDDEIRDDIVRFARDKLLGRPTLASEELSSDMKLACLAVRLGLDFRATNWLDRETERIQVERHMRICLAASPGFRDMITVSSSEPLLAEAASRKMLKWKESPATALLKHIEGSHLSVGERGELVASLLVLLARDTALGMPSSYEDGEVKHSSYRDDEVKHSSYRDDNVKHSSYRDDNVKHSSSLHRLHRLRHDGGGRVVSVTEWLTTLLNFPKDDLLAQLPAKYTNIDIKEQPLSKAFEDAKIWFNHLIKVNSYAIIKQEYLWRLLVRGAAAVCADGQRGLDIIIPILFHDALRKENVSAVLIQVKNDKSFTDSVRWSLFDNMDPFEVDLFSGPDKAPNPVIRMVFALASTKAGIRLLQVPNRSSSRQPGDANFTAYDIWCAGATHETFKVIHSDEEVTYARLLQRLRHMYSPYTLSTQSNEVWEQRSRARRKMHPGVDKEDEHHQQYVVLDENHEDRMMVD